MPDIVLGAFMACKRLEEALEKERAISAEFIANLTKQRDELNQSREILAREKDEALKRLAVEEDANRQWIAVHERAEQRLTDIQKRLAAAEKDRDHWKMMASSLQSIMDGRTQTLAEVIKGFQVCKFGEVPKEYGAMKAMGYEECEP
jgi:2-succinyl-5-enolpyruvyl-6-hydroxy-3-cyclohexene-1-carboxylate synthase